MFDTQQSWSAELVLDGRFAFAAFRGQKKEELRDERQLEPPKPTS